MCRPCVNSRAKAIDAGKLEAERAAAQKEGARFVDTSDWLCTATDCPLIIGDILMFRDINHLTTIAAQLVHADDRGDRHALPSRSVSGRQSKPTLGGDRPVSPYHRGDAPAVRHSDRPRDRPRGLRRRASSARRTDRGSECAWWRASTARRCSTSNSRGLSSKTDQEVLLTLRDLADVLIVGAATVRIEGYGPPRKAGQRVGVVSRRGDIDATTSALHERRRVPDPSRRRPADVGRLCPRRVAARSTSPLRSPQLDADFVQAEGGALLNGALAAADLIDELNLTISPHGGRRQRPASHQWRPLNWRAGCDWPTCSRMTAICSPATYGRRNRQVLCSFFSSTSSRWKSAAASKFL